MNYKMTGKIIFGFVLILIVLQITIHEYVHTLQCDNLDYCRDWDFIIYNQEGERNWLNTSIASTTFNCVNEGNNLEDLNSRIIEFEIQAYGLGYILTIPLFFIYLFAVVRQSQ